MTTIARPYASAAFEYALDHKDLLAWETLLQSAANIVQNETVAKLLQNPSVTKQQLMDLFCDMLKPQLDETKKNFIRLLAEKDRFAALPDIAKQFKATRAEQEKVVTVQVTSAAALDDAYQQKLMKALSKRLQRQVELQCEIDPALLGGAVVRAGDLVIDGSIRGKLTRLVDFI